MSENNKIFLAFAFGLVLGLVVASFMLVASR